MGYDIRKRVKVITESTTITDNDFGGWMVVNTGTADIEVDKVTLQPSQGLDFTASVPPSAHWRTPIQIVITNPGGQAVLSQMICKEEKNESSQPWYKKTSIVDLIKSILNKL